MQAVILAGGKGTRLRPYTAVLPKPLMPIDNFPILEILIRQLKSYGVEDIIIATGYLSHLIEAYFGDGNRFGVNIRYSQETEPMGTAAPISLIKGLDDNFLVMNGDLLTTLNFSDLFEAHVKSGSLLTVSSFDKSVKIDLGVLEIEDNEITNYIEKPEIDYKISMGVYAMSSKCLEYIPENQYYDLPTFVLDLIGRKLKVGVFHFRGRWLDIGRLEDYEAAQNEFINHQEEFLREDL